MVNPNSIGDALGSFFNAAMFNSVLQWAGYLLLIIVVLGFFFLVFMLLQFKYKIRYYEVKGVELDRTGKQFDISNLKPKKDLARPVKKKGIVKWHLLFSHVNIEPVSFEHIQPRNIVYMLRTGQFSFIPCKYNKNFVVGNHLIETLLPMDAGIKFWEQTEIKEAATELMQEGYHKQMMMWAFFCIVAMLIFCAITIWFNLKTAQGTVEKVNFVADAINGLKAMGAP